MYQKLCFTWRVTATGVTGAAHTVLQPGTVGEGVTLVWRPSRGQTLLKENVCMHVRPGQFKTARLTRPACDDSAHHASVVVFRGLCVILLHNTGKAALIGGGAG